MSTPSRIFREGGTVTSYDRYFRFSLAAAAAVAEYFRSSSKRPPTQYRVGQDSSLSLTIFLLLKMTNVAVFAFPYRRMSHVYDMKRGRRRRHACCLCETLLRPRDV